VGSIFTMVHSGVLVYLALVAVAAAVKIPISTTEMTVYRNSSVVALSKPAADLFCASPNLTLRVPESLFIQQRPVASKPAALAKTRPVRRSHVAEFATLRPRPVVDMMEHVYLFLAWLVLFAVVNVLIIDYAYGGPLFEDPVDATLFADLAPVPFVRPVIPAAAAVKATVSKPTVVAAVVAANTILSVIPKPTTAAPVVAADPIHSAKWSAMAKPTVAAAPAVAAKPIHSAIPKPVVRSCAVKPTAAAKPATAPSKDGSDTEC
ncbi:hypothetical protein PFISCL1PPCAC_11844, partial [Pristionchus fissidentatus]